MTFNAANPRSLCACPLHPWNTHNEQAEERER